MGGPCAVTIGDVSYRRTPQSFLPVRRFLLAALLLGAAPSAFGETVEIRSINRTYSELGAQIAPIVQGPFTIAIQSPRHELRVHGNRLDLQKVGDRVIVRFEVDLEGSGHLIADITGPNDTKTRLEDVVVARRQKISAAAEVKLQKSPDGYYMTLLSNQTPSLGFVVESGIVRRILDICSVFEIIPALGLVGCDALGTALTTLRVPMPQNGTVYNISNTHLTEAERAFFDRFASPL